MNTLQVQKQKNIGIIQFHRPEQLNAFNKEMFMELEETIENFNQDSEISILLFKGDDEAFIAGGDMTEHLVENREEVYPYLLSIGELMEKIASLNKLTIAAVEGVTIGGGCELVTSCDICIASESASFRYIQSRLGISTAWGGGSRLIQKVGASKAIPLLLTGEKISSKQAYDLGLVDQLLPNENFNKNVLSFAKRLARSPQPLIQLYKQLGQQIANGIPLSQLYPIEADVCSRLWESETHRKAVDSFFQRSK
ncbi:enoyl-CoA hydratase/isomerase family protein [Risungbinella massiliensis]|uniref:enoyl-CoA hydratase/isomerase family protein n=1 Tax=Risungbinella massiliensis TaxID=1329796 RepID=UPI0005CC38EC|nr:enoyl-CoA hydratase/isomerase family protein [Risungbinella massiliensis]